VFGPRPRNYGFKVNKKVKRLARKSALTHKLNENNIIIVEDFNFDTPSTKLYSNALASFELLDNKSLLVLDKPNNNILLSSRNLRKAKVVLASELNTYDIMNASKMLFIESSIKVVEETF
jgi:large subunit ribosomal protein L4